MTKKNEKNDLIIWVTANEKYFDFAAIYPIFALKSNPNAIVEIGLLDIQKFQKKYNHIIDFYNKYYFEKVFFTPLENKKGIIPTSYRFLHQPINKAKYLYIGDIDILITEDIITPHLENMKRNKLDFSNKRRGSLEVLTGLHFIEYDKMYPLNIPNDLDLKKYQDEALLFYLMKKKGYKIPDKDSHKFRPILGIHASYFNRPMLPTKTIGDEIVSYPSWYDTLSDDTENLDIFKKYLIIKQSPELISFFKHVRSNDVKIRQIIQTVDLLAYFIVSTNFKIK